MMDNMQTNLSTALSAVADTDVAVETSQLIQSEILAKMSLGALSIANQRYSELGQLIGLGNRDY